MVALATTGTVVGDENGLKAPAACSGSGKPRSAPRLDAGRSIVNPAATTLQNLPRGRFLVVHRMPVRPPVSWEFFHSPDSGLHRDGAVY